MSAWFVLLGVALFSYVVMVRRHYISRIIAAGILADLIRAALTHPLTAQQVVSWTTGS